MAHMSRRKLITILLLVLILVQVVILLLLGRFVFNPLAVSRVEPTQTPTTGASPSPSPTPVPPTLTRPPPSPTQTATPTDTPTPTATPTTRPTALSSQGDSLTLPSPTPSPTPTASPSRTPTPTSRPVVVRPAFPTPTPIGGQPPPGPTSPALSEEYWLAEYYDNANLQGVPALVRQDPPNLEFNWYLESPGPGIPADNFSARWTRLVNFYDGGDAVFYAEVDDGIKIYVDGQIALDNWNLSAPITYRGGVQGLSPGLHTVTVEYFESGGYARIKVWGDRTRVGDADWQGYYFANPELQDPPVLVRQDESIDFDWNDDEPIAGLPRSDFSIRWRRTIFFEEGGDYRFAAVVDEDDRVRIYLDDWLLVDDESDDDGRTINGYFSDLGAGFHTVTVEYIDEGGDARILFGWARR